VWLVKIIIAQALKRSRKGWGTVRFTEAAAAKAMQAYKHVTAKHAVHDGTTLPNQRSKTYDE